MRVVQINGGVFGSTGKIMFGIAKTSEKYGIDTFCAAPITATNRLSKPEREYYKIGSYYARKASAFFDRILSNQGVIARRATKKMIRVIDRFSPDIIHIHNIHGGFLNFELFFKYVKSKKIKLVWTFHDCWPFTGHCPYFTIVKCDKWQTSCERCPQPKIYPKMYVDTSKAMYRKKKEWIGSLDNLTVVTPSRWLAELAAQSFFKDHQIKVINNGIDLSVFYPRESNFKKKYGIEDKYMLLGVSFDWGYRKGLDVFIELSRRLDLSYQIVLVGGDDNIDKQLPSNIISIHRTTNQIELAEIYSSADLFVNPTREENYPTVNMESVACGTPVLTFRTGGSPEIIDETCGSVVDVDDVDAMYDEIIRICNQKPYSQNSCLSKAKTYDMNDKFKEYVELYEHITHIAKRSIQ